VEEEGAGNGSAQCEMRLGSANHVMRLANKNGIIDPLCLKRERWTIGWSFLDVNRLRTTGLVWQRSWGYCILHENRWSHTGLADKQQINIIIAGLVHNHCSPLNVHYREYYHIHVVCLWHSTNAIDLWNGTFPECYLTASRKNLPMQLIFLLPIVILLISNKFGLKCHTISGGSRFNLGNRRRRVPGKYTSRYTIQPLSIQPPAQHWNSFNQHQVL